MATTGTGKVVLQQDPIKGDRAWQVTTVDGITTYIPKSTIVQYTPHNKTIYVEAWILKQKGIKYKLHGK